MGLQQVLNALTFYNGTNFTPYAEVPGSQFDLAAKDFVTQKIVELYNFSTTARAALDAIADRGPINFLFLANDTGRFVGPAPNNTGDSYIRIDPAATVSAINKTGEVYDVPFIVNLGHELSHYATGARDTFDPIAPNDPTSADIRNEVWNDAAYDWDGANLPYENAIVRELIDNNRIVADPEPIRAGYNSGVGSGFIDQMGLDRGISYTNGDQIDYVRYGDFESTSKNDNIEMFDNSKAFLTFGFSGDDLIKLGFTTSGSGHNFAYGGTGNDRLGSQGSNYLYGEAGDDTLIAKGEHKSYLFGGDGNDKIFAENAEVETGAGADEVWVPLGGNVTITDGDFSDTLYLDGHKITGGQLRLVDFEKIPDGQAMGMEYWIQWATFNDNGVLFESINNDLEIMLPNTKITLNNWQDGDFGIHLHESGGTISIQENWGIVSYEVTGPDTPLSLNDSWNYAGDLMYELHNNYTPGPATFPDMFF